MRAWFAQDASQKSRFTRRHTSTPALARAASLLATAQTPSFNLLPLRPLNPSRSVSVLVSVAEFVSIIDVFQIPAGTLLDTIVHRYETQSLANIDVLINKLQDGEFDTLGVRLVDLVCLARISMSSRHLFFAFPKFTTIDLIFLFATAGPATP